MGLSYSYGREFVRQLCPILERQDQEAAFAYLERYWPNENLRDVLSCGHEDAERTALACLCLTGTMADMPAVTPLLHHKNALTAALSEHALWCIWFRAGDVQANRTLVQAVHLIADNQLDRAIELLDRLVTRCPQFAEAYNQRAIACFLDGNYDQAAADCHETLRLNPNHFGAMAGLGHSYVSLGRLTEALDVYRRALTLHPRMEGIRESIQEVQKCLARINASSPP